MSAQDLILLVEDNDLDAMILDRVLKKLRPDIRMLRAENGLEALETLDHERPDLIVMDIRMPLMGGRETLKRIKSNPALCDIPIVMMSTSSNRQDIEYCYRHHANAYMVKSLGNGCGRASIENLLKFWFDTAAR